MGSSWIGGGRKWVRRSSRWVRYGFELGSSWVRDVENTSCFTKESRRLAVRDRFEIGSSAVRDWLDGVREEGRPKLFIDIASDCRSRWFETASARCRMGSSWVGGGRRWVRRGSRPVRGGFEMGSSWVRDVENTSCFTKESRRLAVRDRFEIGSSAVRDWLDGVREEGRPKLFIDIASDCRSRWFEIVSARCRMGSSWVGGGRRWVRRGSRQVRGGFEMGSSWVRAGFET